MKERKADSFPGLAELLPIQEAEWIPNRLNPEKATWRHVRVKLLKTEDKKEKKRRRRRTAAREKRGFAHGGEAIRTRASFSSENTKAEEAGHSSSAGRKSGLPDATPGGRALRGRAGRPGRRRMRVSPEGVPHALGRT